MPDKKILFVIGRCPYPLDTGAKIRTWNILTGLASSYVVDVLFLTDGSDHPDWMDIVKSKGVRDIYPVSNHAINKSITIGQLMSAVAMGMPLSSMKYQSKLLEQKFVGMLRGYDMVHVETIHLANLLNFVAESGQKIVTSVNAHNVEYVIAERMCALEKNPLKKIALALHARNMKKFEQKAFTAADIVYAVSPKEVGEIDALAGVNGRALLVDNGVDLTYFSPGTEEINENDLVFVGSMDWAPNVDGVLWFVENIYPSIKKKRPEARLLVVGRSPGEAILELGRADSSIVITGTVDDVRPYVRHAAVVVVPLRYGGGTRLKILEAFSMKKALVSTTLGCEGIECSDGVELFVKDDPDGFIQACLELMGSKEKRESIGEAGYRLGTERYSWERIIRNIVTATETLFSSHN